MLYLLYNFQRRQIMGIRFNEKTNEFEEVPDTDEETNIPVSSPKEPEMVLSENAPVRIYDERTGCFEYKDPELRKKAEERKKLKNIKDELQFRLNGIRKHLKRAGLENDIGKTGNPSTQELSEDNKKAGTIQKEHAKEYILRNRKQRNS